MCAGISVRGIGWTAVLLLAAVLAGCGGEQAGEQPQSAEQDSATTMQEVPPAGEPEATEVGTDRNKDWERYVSGFIHGYFEHNPTAAVDAGKHEYDGQLPDWSEAGLQAHVQWLKAQRQQAKAFPDEALTEANQFQKDYLLSEIDESLFWMETADWPSKNPMWYAFSLGPSVYLTREYAPLSERMEAYTRYAENLPKALEQMRANLETPLPRTYVETARGILGGMVTYLRDSVPGIFAGVEDEALQADFEKANAGAVAALEQAVAWFEKRKENATDDYALGPELYREMLKATGRVDMPLDRLREIARKDLERNLAAAREACGEYAPGKSLKACADKLKANKPEQGPVQAARDQLAGLRQFLETEDLVTIPGTEEAKVAEAPPYRRFNLAYIEIPGPYEKNLPSTYYIAPPEPDWSEEERQAYIPGRMPLLFVTVHEVWPGHFLHFLHANRAESEFGRLFQDYAYTEGWAHYTEEMMWDAGYGDGDPAVHLGQLSNALLRNVRFLSSVGLHTGEMTVEESIEMFQEKALQDPGNARQQAYRGTFDPGYLNYTLGKLMIMTLREDWTEDRGGREAWKAFHDKFLSYGGPPVPLVREAILGEDADGPLIRVPEPETGQSGEEPVESEAAE